MDGNNPTALDVFRMAYATSKLNEAGRVADESGELLSLLNSKLRSYFADGARVNARFYAKKIEVAFDAPNGGWPRPAAAEMVIRIEAGGTMGANPPLAVGTEIVDLPFDQRHIEPGRPAVYNFGQRWYTRGTAIDPVSGSLIIFASAKPAKLVAINEHIDPLWPDACTPLLKWDIAIYLARKDGNRGAEVEAFTAERASEYADYLKYLKHETITEVRSYGFGRPFNNPGVTEK